MLLLGARWDPLGQTGDVRGAELELGSVPVGQHRALPLPGVPCPLQGTPQDVLCSAGPVPGALQGTPFLGNSSGERFLPEVNVRTPFALFCTGRIHGFVFLCIFGHPKFFPGSVEVLLGLWGLGSAATAGSQGGSWPWNWKTKRVLGGLLWD